jgi:hypothetical protein
MPGRAYFFTSTDFIQLEALVVFTIHNKQVYLPALDQLCKKTRCNFSGMPDQYIPAGHVPKT